MGFDAARVRGVYPGLGGGWIQLNPQLGMQMPEAVASAIAKSLRTLAAQPLGPAPEARAAAEVVAQAREAFADLVGGSADGVVLGSSRGSLLSALAEAISPRVQFDSELVLGRINDEAHLVPWLRVAQRYGAKVRWAEIDIETMAVPSWQFEELIGPRTAVVALAVASSATGIVADVHALARECRRAGTLLVLDATAAAPYVSLDINDIGADVIVVSAEKWGGPKVSAMIFRNPDEINRFPVTALDPRLADGPGRLEVDGPPVSLLPGVTASVNHLAAFESSVTGARRDRLPVSLGVLYEHQQRLLQYVLGSLDQLPTVRVVGRQASRLPIFSFTVVGVEAALVAQRLADNKIATIAGEPSRALTALGVDDVGGAVTVGMGPFTTPFELDELVRVVASLT